MWDRMSPAEYISSKWDSLTEGGGGESFCSSELNSGKGIWQEGDDDLFLITMSGQPFPSPSPILCKLPVFYLHPELERKLTMEIVMQP